MPCNYKQLSPAQCNLEIDYSEVTGDRILPFQISLNLMGSNLEPSAGENQRFCYDITAVGEDTRLYADLSHLVLGICDQIPAEQIAGITVTIDGEPREVIFGEDGNVELRPADRPDPPTGCSGLKFDFPLNKVTGTMAICFELTVPREVIPTGVCLFGGGVTASGLYICGPGCTPLSSGCSAAGYHRSTVCVPITVTPYAHVGTPSMTCCGAPTVTPGNPCEETNTVCQFTICQQVCVRVPVEFGATATAGTPCVQCGAASSTDLCSDCGAVDTAAHCKPREFWPQL